jgi:hypothetical protein
MERYLISILLIVSGLGILRLLDECKPEQKYFRCIGCLRIREDFHNYVCSCGADNFCKGCLFEHIAIRHAESV